MDDEAHLEVGIPIVFDQYGEHHFESMEEHDAYERWYLERHPPRDDGGWIEVTGAPSGKE